MENHPDDHQPPPPGGGGRAPRKELQGPRPTPLKVSKDSFKIKKPPVVPPPVQGKQPPQQPPRQPVIIYSVSPKVIHANPSEFMTIVQRLTGPGPTTSTSSSSSSSSSSSTSSFQFPSSSSFSAVSDHHGVMMSPAARLAAIERTKMPLEGVKMMGGVEGAGILGAEKTGFFPGGVLSPGPGSLPPISPNLFSPFFQHNFTPSSLTNLQHHHQPSSTRNYMEVSNVNNQTNPFSTNNFTSPSPTTISPSSLDMLRSLFDN